MNNKRYDDGETIPILFDTNIKKVDLFVGQLKDDGKLAWFLVQSRKKLPLIFLLLLIMLQRRS